MTMIICYRYTIDSVLYNTIHLLNPNHRVITMFACIGLIKHVSKIIF